MLRVAPVLLLAAIAAFGASLAAGRTATPKAAPSAGLPRYVAGYKQWYRLNRRPLPPRASDPHLGTKNVYASRRPRVRRTRIRYPYGTIVVKDARRPGKKHVGLVAIMRKLRGSNPRHNDWQFVEYARDDPRARFEVIASGSVCYSCHVRARKRDYVWTKPRR